MEVLQNFFATYGLVLSILALSGIVFLGILKKAGVFKKVKTDVKKYVYFGVSCIVSIFACTLYLLIKNAFVFADYVALCVAVISLTISVYGIYENTGLRKLWNKIIDIIFAGFKKFCIKVFSSKKVTQEDIKKALVDLGSQTLTELAEVARQNEQNKVEETQPTQQA